ncbi:hypothetical protein LOTGIDRAFT_236983 [Lottia gigantea]|uniref:PPM-type phosphatase domain-containing protein n=1 Tax=Lottia gigantea TaxID=225164 RepID=V3ZEJ9_LOTGI|nr:hypothetical protein LOTGIDRAFT_236983 [Lottia gigantea]ESO82507.1 hypothetical protein LOTGIDRAFT_236983 [Lottia gigantea]
MANADVPSLDLGSLSQSLQNIYDIGTMDTTIDNDLGSGYVIQIGTEDFKGINIRRSDTPNTYLPEFTNKPDITLKCEQCGYFVDISTLLEHRKYHASLVIMKYKCDSLPESWEELFKRRNQLIRKIKQSTSCDLPPDPHQIQVIDEAYEYMKAHLEDTFHAFRHVEENIDTSVNGVALNCSPSCVYAVGIASSANRKWKSSMEDTKIYQDCFGDDSEKCYLGIFDGHNGHTAAETASTEFHKILLSEMRKFDPKTKSSELQNIDDNQSEAEVGDSADLYGESVNLVQQIIKICEEKYQQVFGEATDDPPKKCKGSSKFKTIFSERMSEAYKKAYRLFDILLSYGKDERSKVRWSGCSALNIVIQNTQSDTNSQQNNPSEQSLKEIGLIHLANAGNVNCLLIRGNRSYRLNKQHSPDNIKERKRVIKAGGNINMASSDCPVNGVLSTTRGLGNHGDIKMKKSVIVEPYTTCVSIDQYAQFVVMASSGVWEVFSDEEVASLLLKLLPCNQIPIPSPISDSIASLLKHEDPLVPNATSTSRDSLSVPSISTRAAQNKMEWTDVKPDTLTIAADLNTEIGSHRGDDHDTILHDNEMMSVPVNCDIPDHKPQTVSDFRRELAKSMAEYLVQAALLAGSRDNITVMITLLPGSGV